MGEPSTVEQAPVGAGILAKMAELSDSPAWVNEYQLFEGAITLGASGRLYVFDANSGKVHWFQPSPSR